MSLPLFFAKYRRKAQFSAADRQKNLIEKKGRAYGKKLFVPALLAAS